MAGYSGTPLAKKLGIKDQFRVSFSGLPAEVKAELKDALKTCRIAKDVEGSLDFAMIFVKNAADLQKSFSEFSQRLAPAGMLWVSWPKRTSGVATDLDENKVRTTGLAAGLVDVKVCAVSDVWSGLKFVIRLKDRRKA
ncbi:MAG TPA: DUF3052 family protein [Terriglobales bacterium]|nr:DUF3052 family protein [Terriglobales bacterium]